MVKSLYKGFFDIFLIFLTHYVYKGLNRIRNILLYDLLTDLSTRAKECNIKIKRIYARMIYAYNVASGLPFINLYYKDYLLLTYIIYND